MPSRSFSRRCGLLFPNSSPSVTVRSNFRPPEGWKVYDVVVAGVSLVTNYRDTFNQEVRANGVDGLIDMLAKKNNQMDPGRK